MSPQEEQIQYYLDGEMSSQETENFERKLEADSGLRAALEREQELSSLLAVAGSYQREPENIEQFNEGIRSKIAQEAGAQSENLKGFRKVNSKTGSSLPWTAFAGMAASLCALLLAANLLGIFSSSAQADQLHVYAPVPGSEAKTWYSKEADAVVVEVNGLNELPADQNISGHRAVSTGLHEAECSHQYLCSHDGGLLYVMVRNPGSAPSFYSPW